MLQFLNPIWLLAIGAIIIPLAIHLWNVKKGKTLKIGSIQLLGESSKQNSRSLRLQDLWLLLLRCLLLIVLAMLLAAPLFIRKAPAERIKGWILLDKDHLRETYQAFKPSIDSLQKLGFQTHYFNPGFKEFQLADTAEIEQNKHVSQLSYWSLAKALDDQLPANASAYIFTNNRLNRFKGIRPLMKSDVTWKTYRSSDSVFNKIAGAYMTSKDSLRIILAQSTPGRTSYARENTSVEGLNPAYELTRPKRKAIRFSSAGDLKDNIDSSAMEIDTSVLHIALFTDKHPADLAYVQAALEAVQSFSQRRISVKVYRDHTRIPEGPGWVFWLSELPVNASVRSRVKNIFSYQPGKNVNTNNASIQTNGNVPFDLSNTGLHKRKAISQVNQKDHLLWEDETGGPILTRSAKGEYAWFKFYSRFDPEWSDLVWDPRFPEALLQLVLSPDEKTSGLTVNDRRTMPLSQIIPATVNDASTRNEVVKLKETHFDRYLWVLFVLLLVLERWISARQKSIRTNG